jgi:Family of unknown function (DUF5682)
MLTILGIRHHGVGSARNVVEMLHKLQPDMILVESPPELDDITKWVGDKLLKPPVAVLGYNQDNAKQAVFYPFAEFSPEWQAIAYANAKALPCRMMDLPLAIGFQIQASPDPSRGGETDAKTEADISTEQPTVPPPREGQGEASGEADPISYFARLDGFNDSEAWWEQKFEQKFSKATVEDHFEAVMLMMTTLRTSDVFSETREAERQNDIREAYMRQIIRKAQNDMYNNIVVVCGAWHAPALLELDKSAKEDAKILKALPKTKIKVGVTLIPWTNERLSYLSGYGAGITSPGWYEHVWKYPTDNGVRWLTKVAKLFRSKKMDVSTAHVIETFRLAEALAALRGQARLGLYDHQEAIQTVMCMGDGILLELIKKEMIVGNKLGKVPDNVPKMPLQADFEAIAKKMKFAMTAEYKDVELDLRKDLDLQRSIFLFRLQALHINWARSAYSRSKGTFKEAWHLKWQPEMMIALIEKGIYGNTVETAAENFILAQAKETKDIAEIAAFIQQAIPAELFSVIENLLNKLNELATISADIVELMTAVVPLVDVSRYGNVRKTDLSTIYTLVEGLITRIAIGLPTTCYGTDDAASQMLFEHIRKVNDAVRLLENTVLSDLWQDTLFKILNKDGVNPLLTGCTCRLLFDAKAIDEVETADRFGLALSSGNETVYSAGFVEGFLKGSGMILLYDHTLWNILYKWVVELPDTQFDELLPILRRTFAKFEPADRRKLGEKAKQGHAAADVTTEALPSEFFDVQRAESVLPSVVALLGWT